MSIYDKASLVLIPSGTKTSKVYSQKPVSGDGDFTFSRSTAATRVNADGNIEKETMNLMPYSNDFSQWSPKSGTFTQGVADPFGGNNAWSLTATNIDPYLYRNPSITGVITLSVWAKGVGSSIGKNFLLVCNGSSPSTQSHTLTSEWVRYESYFNATSTAIIGFEIPNPSVVGEVVHIYGAQLEYGLVARDYIETTTAAVEGGITDNVPRLDYTDSSCPSLKLEPQRTNLITQSEYFGAWGNDSNTSLTANAIQSPSGFVDAYKMSAGTSNARQSRILNVSVSGSLAFSTYAKKGEYSVVQLTDALDAALYANFDLENGVLGNYNNCTPSIEDAGDGWYRCIITWTASANINKVRISIAESKTQGRLVNFAGNGTDGIYIYGAQLEAGSFATSIIPTYGTSVTRNADESYANGQLNQIGQTEGTIYVEFEIPEGYSGTDAHRFQLSDNTTNNWIFVSINNGNDSRVYYRAASSTQIDYNVSDNLFTAGTTHKIAFAYKNGDSAYYVNGVQKQTWTSGLNNPTSELDVYNITGSSPTYTNSPQNMSNNVKQTMLFKTRLSNEELIDLTT